MGIIRIYDKRPTLFSNRFFQKHISGLLFFESIYHGNQSNMFSLSPDELQPKISETKVAFRGSEF